MKVKRFLLNEMFVLYIVILDMLLPQQWVKMQ
jgi:hypothetical protein